VVIAAARFPRITVRALMAVVAGFALLLGFHRTRHTWGYLRHVAIASVGTWVPVLILLLILVPRLRGRVPRRVVRILGLVSLAISFYLLWAFFLAMLARNGGVLPDGWPRGFPFPDRPLEVLTERFDVLHPAPFGTIKLHGESPRVLDLVGRLTILSAIVTGSVFALFVRSRPSKNEA
jgi:hypothetical protein